MSITYKIIEQFLGTPNFLSMDIPLTDEDVRIICRYLSEHPGITRLDLHGNKLSNEALKILAKNTTLKELTVSNNGITDEGAEALAANTTLLGLWLFVNKIGDKGAQALAKNKTLRTLDLTHNKISDQVIKVLKTNTTIPTLRLPKSTVFNFELLDECTKDKNQLILRDSGLTDKNLEVVCDYLSKHPEIIALELSGTQITEEGIKLLAKNTTLKALKLVNTRITDEGAEVLAENTTLIELDLSINRIGDKGALALAKNSNFTHLNLRNNQISNKGALALAENTTLLYLNLAKNKIGMEGAQALRKNPHLQWLDLLANDIPLDATQLELCTDYYWLDLRNAILDDRDIPVICDYLEAHPEITKLDLGGNYISTEGLKILAKNNTLKTLTLSNNQINDEGAEALAANNSLLSLLLFVNKIGDKGAKALAKNNTLTELNLNHNQIGEEGIQALEQNKKLRTLHVRHQKPIRLAPINLREDDSSQQNTQVSNNTTDINSSQNTANLPQEPDQQKYIDLLKKIEKLTSRYYNHLDSDRKKTKKNPLLTQKLEHLQALDSILREENIAPSLKVKRFYDHLNKAETQMKTHRDPDWKRYVKNTLIAAGILLTGILPGLAALAVYMHTGNTAGKSVQFWKSKGEVVVEQFKDLQKDTENNHKPGLK